MAEARGFTEILVRDYRQRSRLVHLIRVGLELQKGGGGPPFIVIPLESRLRRTWGRVSPRALG